MVKTLFPYLTLDGEGQEAVKFYEKTLGAKVVKVQTFGEAHQNPEKPIPEDAKDRIMNAHLIIGDTDLMISDTFPEPHQKNFVKGNQVTIALIADDVAESEAIFEQLQDGGEVIMPLQETFWSPSYGQLTDRFGVRWQISTDA